MSAFFLFCAGVTFLSGKLVDSHAHINMAEFDQDRPAVIERAFKNNIAAILCPAELAEPERLQVALDLNASYENIILAAGNHPHLAKDYREDFPGRLKDLAASGAIKAVGEIGLDFHYNLSPPETQMASFRNQLAAAKEIGLPVIIHSRNAAAQVLEAVKQEHYTEGGVLHCFTEDWNSARQMLDLGFFISFSGILTFPKAFDLRETAKKIPVKRLLVETDSPFLTPVPFRGKVKRNEPFYVRETARILASLKNISYEDLADQTTKNFEKCFLFEIKKAR